MVRICLAFLLALNGLLATGAEPAQDAGPEALVKRVTNEVLTILREDKGIEAGDRQRAISVIETKIAPHFDFARMTMLAVGPAWRRASADQQQALVREFKTLLVRTYANALVAYRNQTVRFKSSKPGEAGEVTVRSQIVQPGGQPISLDYSLARSGEEWKVYDVVIDNISLVTNYRSSFGAEIDQGGVDGLIKTLQDKNRKLESSPPPVADKGGASRPQ